MKLTTNDRHCEWELLKRFSRSQVKSQDLAWRNALFRQRGANQLPASRPYVVRPLRLI